MSTTFLYAAAAIFLVLEILPTATHRLITNPYPVNEWDSVIVSSDPIRIIEKKQNETTRGKKIKKITRARRRSFSDCPENDFKCLYGQNEEQDINLFDAISLTPHLQVLNLSSSGDAEEVNEKHDKNDKNSNSGKSYWGTSNNPDYPHSYDDKNRWVSLDPIPWSTSKISKWQPNVEVHENTHWDYHSSTQRPVHQFWVSGANFRPQKPNVQWGIGSNDIITDNKPSGFPVDHFPNHPSQNSYHEYREPFRKFNHISEHSGKYNSKFMQKSHPSTYPSQGNGEWVLLSTKKGYSQPNRGDNRILWSRNVKPVDISRYHEEDLSDKVTTFSDGLEPKNKTSTERVMVPLQVVPKDSSKDPSKTLTRKVKLQVLPSLESTTLSHGGLLEVESQPAKAELQEEKIKKLQTIANVKKNKIRGFRLVPRSKINGKGVIQRSAYTLAAVGAGMIPATMAILVPMAFNRNKRSYNLSSSTSRPIKSY